MNQVQLTGNLARDPRVGYTSNNKAYAMFTVACSRTISMNGAEKELTDFIPCVAWGKTAERIARIPLSKGQGYSCKGGYLFGPTKKMDRKSTKPR